MLHSMLLSFEKGACKTKENVLRSFSDLELL